jgi:hypothetical protein
VVRRSQGLGPGRLVKTGQGYPGPRRHNARRRRRRGLPVNIRRIGERRLRIFGRCAAGNLWALHAKESQTSATRPRPRACVRAGRSSCQPVFPAPQPQPGNPKQPDAVVTGPRYRPQPQPGDPRQPDAVVTGPRHRPQPQPGDPRQPDAVVTGPRHPRQPPRRPTTLSFESAGSGAQPQRTSPAENFRTSAHSTAKGGRPNPGKGRAGGWRGPATAAPGRLGGAGLN